MINKTYLVEEIFQDIPDDPENILMTIPPEICESMGLNPGDTVKIELQGASLVIAKHE